MVPVNKFRILVDENLHKGIAVSLREAGHEVVFTPKGTKNGRVYQAATSSKLALLTGDKDFLNTRLYPPYKTNGIIVIRIHPPDPGRVMPVLTDMLDKMAPKKIKDKLVVLEEDGFWIESD